MDKQKLYLMALSFVFLVTIIGLVAFNEQRFIVYLSFFAIGYYGITTLLRPRKKYFDSISAVLFLIICSIILMNLLTLRF